MEARMPSRVTLVWIVIAAFSAVALPMLSHAQTATGRPRTFPYPIHESVLDNGLKVVVVPMDSPGIMAHYVVVRAGSRNEVEPGLSGFAHFFEHMMFRGTETYPPEKYNDVLKRLGADSNAFTTDDWTAYHVVAASSALDTVMAIEADRFMNLKYTKEAFQKEAGAVLGEYNKNYSVPIMSIFEKLQDTAYTKHTYKHTTMGFLKDIEDMPNQYDYSIEFFKRWYRPDNCVLVVTGDVDPKAVAALAKKHYGPWKRGAAKLETPVEPEQAGERRAHLAWKNPTLPYLVLGYHAPAFSPESREGAALEVVSQAAFSEASPLYKDLVLDKQWVDQLFGGGDANRDPNLFTILARVKDPSKVAAVREAIYATLERLGREPLPPERLAEVKRRVRYGFLQSLATPGSTARTVANFLQLTGEASSIDRTYATIEAVTAEDVRAAAAKTFRAANRTVITLSREGQDVAGAGDSVRTVLLPSTTAPFVSFRVAFDAGSVHDPAGKEGLAALTAAMLSEGGTRKRTYGELVDALYPLAASIGVQTDKELAVVSGTVHRDNLDAFYALFREVLLEPRFDAVDFERLKADQLNALTSVLRAADDENLGKETLGAAIYAGHPYGRPTIGTAKGIRAITLDDVKAFWSSRYTRESATLGLSGGFGEAVVARAKADLAGLPSGAVAKADLPAPRVPQGIEATIVTKSTRAWAISIGFPIAVTRSDDDFYALMVANSHLGEHRTFNGVLMNKIRGERGINYGDYSYVENFVQEGGSTFPLANIPRRQQLFSIWIRPVAPQHAHFSIRAAMRELDRLVKDGMTAQQFEETRAFLLNYSRLWTQTASRRLGYELDGRFYGRKSLVDEVAERLPKLTLEQVNAAIRKHLASKGAYLAVVADEQGAAAFVEALKSNAPSPISYATETKPEVLEEDKAIAVYPLAIEPSKVRVVPASAMFEE
jgi:zinc protease